LAKLACVSFANGRGETIFQFSPLEKFFVRTAASESNATSIKKDDSNGMEWAGKVEQAAAH